MVGGWNEVLIALDGLVKPHAFVALRPEVRAEGLEEALQALAREKLEPYKCPPLGHLLPELAKTATGKIQRCLLRQKRTASRGGNGISHEVGYS